MYNGIARLSNGIVKLGVACGSVSCKNELHFQGNYVGATEADLKKMSPEDLKCKVGDARNALFKCGSHFVIDTVNELPHVIEEINRRLELGIAP